MSTTHDDRSAEPPGHDVAPKSTGDSIVSRTCSGSPEQLTVLDDQYAREILTVLGRGPHRGRELAETTDFSRPTVYRRLNRLEDAGLVTSRIRLDPDGSHCKEFILVRTTLQVSIEDGTLTVTAPSTASHE